MIITLGYLIACVALAYVGTKFMVWCVKRSLPVPPGPFLLLRFLFWWWSSLFVAFLLYMLALVAIYFFVLDYIGPDVVFEDSVIQIGLVIMGIPYLIGLFKGCDLQLDQRWSA